MRLNESVGNSKFTDKEKIDAIKSLLKNGRDAGARSTEWAEAALLDKIELIIDEKVSDLSSKTLKKLMNDAASEK
jgi:hypothetical protein